MALARPVAAGPEGVISLLAPQGVQMQLAYILNQQGRYTESIKLSDFILGKNNSFINAYLNKGYSLIGLDRYKEAINNFEQARQLDSDNLTVYLGYAKAYSGLKDYNRAIEIYDSVIKYFSTKGQDSPQLKILQNLRKEQIELRKKVNYQRVGGNK